MSRKRILLLGPTGSGKSTIGNCLIPNSFPSSDSLAQGNTRPLIVQNEEYLICDTVGTGYVDLSQAVNNIDIVRDLYDVMTAQHATEYDVILFVVEKNRMTATLQESVDVVNSFYLNTEARANLYLVITKCRSSSWIDQNFEGITRLMNIDRDRVFNVDIDIDETELEQEEIAAKRRRTSAFVKSIKETIANHHSVRYTPPMRNLTVENIKIFLKDSGTYGFVTGAVTGIIGIASIAMMLSKGRK